MEISSGSFYAIDHTSEDGTTETNVMLVLSKRPSGIGEVKSDFYVTETMLLRDGEIESLHQNDWLPQFLEREATISEIETFNHNRQLNEELKHWAEQVTGLWIR